MQIKTALGHTAFDTSCLHLFSIYYSTPSNNRYTLAIDRRIDAANHDIFTSIASEQPRTTVLDSGLFWWNGLLGTVDLLYLGWRGCQASARDKHFRRSCAGASRSATNENPANFGARHKGGAVDCTPSTNLNSSFRPLVVLCMAGVLMWTVVNILRDAPLVCEAIIEAVEKGALGRVLEDGLLTR